MASETCFLKDKQTEESIAAHVFNVIDSKIQYLDHKTKGIVNHFVPTHSMENVEGEAKSDSPLSIQEVEEIFALFEQQSRRKKLLLKLRSLLTVENALLVLALLKDDTFLAFEEQDIYYILGIKQQKHAA